MSDQKDARLRVVRGDPPHYRLLRVYVVDMNTGVEIDLPVMEVQRNDYAQDLSTVTLKLLALRVEESTKDQEAIRGYE